MEWENSSDCVDEYKNFTDCMRMEQRRYNWMGAEEREKLTKYDYMQKRFSEKKFLNIFKLNTDQNIKEEGRSMSLKERIQLEKE